MTKNKKYLIIYVHPNPKSLCASVKNKLINIFKSKSIQYHVIDLYNENFNPVLNSDDFIAINSGMYLKDVEKYQKLITEYKNLIFIYPIWWVGPPALLKGWIDRVFAYNFAYSTDKNSDPYGMLKSINADVIITMGQTIPDYKENGLYYAVTKSMNIGILEFCSINVEKWFICDNVNKADESKLSIFLQDIDNYYKKR